ncbi:cytochrome-c oxidase, cbb3-type subunit I [Gemmatimonas groenlandica]|uniref:cytochrome-c oxidase n=1 Tax=Gemmatimonas groenlandica TaxID=2732249 RepID=A0A6M4IQ18_9BACT|nr:cytochrome-c oxidase, cbb3-type subunit I [Gemmatimonas groenlandica]QJR37024.1 cytochrome-c oxidase, cbb3-type subunit I [Gemmatimonas groenlandica]
MTPAPSAAASVVPRASAATLDRFSYDDAIVRKFLFATLIWGVVGMLVGLLIALQLANPIFNFNVEWLSFGRLRPLHTNAVIFAFAGNAFFTGCYYSTQRLLKARMFSDGLSKFHFWGWQAIIVSAALTLPLGFTQAKEYAELEWPIDIAIAVVWVAFAVNFFGTLIKRRERHIYVALWFYIASIVTVAILHIFNNLSMPAGLFKSYSIYAGVQDAFMQWWYGHNAVAFFLTTPFLGLMYYFMPKAAEGPVFSYKLSILHFWSLVFMYIWAGPHHLHYTALPEWASTVGMLFSVMLWAPSWGGMINGLLTLRGAWHKVASDPVLKFFVVGITAYGMSTFEGPMLSIKSVNALAHYTDWIIAHVHTGALGWNGFMTFGMVYWLLPRLFQTEIYSKKAMELHFWIGSVGIVLYVVAIYSAGVTQGLMWRAFDETGRLAYPDFVETVVKLLPMYWMRVVGGSFFIVGMFIFGWNIIMTWMRRPAHYEVPIIEAAPLSPKYVDDNPAVPANGLWARFNQVQWHRAWERAPMLFTALTILAVVVASLFEILPTFLIKSNVPTIASVKPYTPLELAGRDMYIAEGCFNCHSQMVRPFRYETERFGEYSKPGESVYEHPFLWGSRRIGPDLAREGGKYPDLWHVRHFENPRAVTAKSIMPAYSHFLTKTIDFEQIQSRVDAMAMVGVPYGDAVNKAPAMAREQAKTIAAAIVEQGGPRGLEDKQIVAIVAYMQRLGRDIKVQKTASKGAR